MTDTPVVPEKLAEPFYITQATAFSFGAAGGSVYTIREIDAEGKISYVQATVHGQSSEIKLLQDLLRREKIRTEKLIADNLAVTKIQQELEREKRIAASQKKAIEFRDGEIKRLEHGLFALRRRTELVIGDLQSNLKEDQMPKDGHPSKEKRSRVDSASVN